MNSMLTAERFGRWEKRCASVMWFSTFFRWVVSSGASGGLPWHTVSSRAMETQAGSMPFSAMVARWGRRRAHRGPLFFFGTRDPFHAPILHQHSPSQEPSTKLVSPRCHPLHPRSAPVPLQHHGPGSGHPPVLKGPPQL